MDYWVECILESFDAAGIVTTDEQIAIVASCVKGAHENLRPKVSRRRLTMKKKVEGMTIKEAIDMCSHWTCPDCPIPQPDGYCILANPSSWDSYNLTQGVEVSDAKEGG